MKRLGLKWDGQSFTYRDINFHWTDLKCMSKEDFDKAYEGASKRMEQLKTEEKSEFQGLEDEFNNQKEGINFPEGGIKSESNEIPDLFNQNEKKEIHIPESGIHNNVRDYIIGMAKRFNVMNEKFMVGIYEGKMVFYKYDEHNNPEWGTLYEF